jgi:hypothetical protein
MYQDARAVPKTTRHARPFGGPPTVPPAPQVVPVPPPQRGEPIPVREHEARGFYDVNGIYVESARESVWFSRIQDARDRRELNPHGYSPPPRRRQNRRGYR